MTFADGVKIFVHGKGTRNVEGFPKLENVLYVKDFKVNLLSIS